MSLPFDSTGHLSVGCMCFFLRIIYELQMLIALALLLYLLWNPPTTHLRHLFQL